MLCPARTPRAPRMARRDWTSIYSLPLGGEEAETEARGGSGGALAAAAAATPTASEDVHPWLAATLGCSHDHAAEQRVFDMPTSEKLAACAVMRRLANVLYREGALGRALALYRRCLAYYEYAFPDLPSDQLALNWARLLCLLNIAAAHLRLRDVGEAVAHCRQAVSLIAECRELVADVAPAERADTEHRLNVMAAKALSRWAQAESDAGKLDDAAGRVDEALRLLSAPADGEAAVAVPAAADSGGEMPAAGEPEEEGGGDGGERPVGAEVRQLLCELHRQRRRIDGLSAGYRLRERAMAASMFGGSKGGAGVA